MSETPPAEESTGGLEQLFRSGRWNAVLAWFLVGVLVLVFVESALEFDRQWVTFVAIAAVIVLVPPVARGSWRVMLPWELLAVALLPILVYGLFGSRVGPFAYYLSIAGLALVVTVELHTFTSLEMTHWFAVTFVVMTTMASVAAWSVVRWTLDRLLGTSYLASNDALMVEFAWVTVGGFAAGVLFDAYFRRLDRWLWRLIRRRVGR
ncbi:hypothetical protein [Halorussus litoreus]|uniref:hypothetical protein n=1 Tax=Halorussus litoreus TaxID=1710536 RepID=UPI000E275422|nr:hypothetical protein [Halorussus litoreus]